MSEPIQTPVFEVEYERGHTIAEAWEATDIFCPACGARRVWVAMGGGDYYEGPHHLCAACGAGFSLPRLYKEDKTNWQDKQRLEVIRAVVEPGDDSPGSVA